MMTDVPRDESGLHVAIIGAGVVGLLLAQGLKKVSHLGSRILVSTADHQQHGISYEIFEQEESATFYRAREWGMSIHWAMPTLEQILPKDLFDQVQTDASVNPKVVVGDEGTELTVYNAESGELVKKVPWGKFIRVSRRKMRALCAGGIDVQVVSTRGPLRNHSVLVGQYKKDFRALRIDIPTDRPKALFSDGTSITADLIVGADGANSTIRDSLYVGGEGQATTVPYGGVNMHVCYNNATVAQHVYDMLGSAQCSIAVHPKGHWLWASVQDVTSEDPSGWIFQLQWTWKLGEDTAALSERKLGILKKEAEETFGEPWKSFWTSIPDSDALVPPTRIAVWPPLPIPDDCFRGKVALVGDAAHAMSFHRGQGLNHGITDVGKLVSRLIAHRKAGLREALDEYESEMVKRAGEEVALSKVNTEMLHDWERAKESPFMKGGGTAENR